MDAERLARIETKLDFLLEAQDLDQEWKKSIDLRVRGLESKRSYILGGFGMLGVVVSVGLSVAALMR